MSMLIGRGPESIRGRSSDFRAALAPKQIAV